MSKTEDSGVKLREMNTKQKLQYIWDYYKLPILGVLILLYIIVYGIFRYAARTEPVLYVGLVNVGGSIAEDPALTSGFLSHQGGYGKRAEVVLFRNLYLTADPKSEYYSYSQASEIKILGNIEAKTLDVVIVNKEAFDAFKEQDFFSETAEITDGELIRSYGFTEPVYCGIIKNTPRPEVAEAYFEYLSK